MKNALKAFFMFLIFLGVCWGISWVHTDHIETTAKREVESKLRMTEDCWQAYDLKITVPFICSEYMIKGRVQ